MLFKMDVAQADRFFKRLSPKQTFSESLRWKLSVREMQLLTDAWPRLAPKSFLNVNGRQVYISQRKFRRDTSELRKVAKRVRACA